MDTKKNKCGCLSLPDAGVMTSLWTHICRFIRTSTYVGIACFAVTFIALAFFNFILKNTERAAFLFATASGNRGPVLMRCCLLFAKAAEPWGWPRLVDARSLLARMG